MQEGQMRYKIRERHFGHLAQAKNGADEKWCKKHKYEIEEVT